MHQDHWRFYIFVVFIDVELLVNDVIVPKLSEGRVKSLFLCVVANWVYWKVSYRETYKFVSFGQFFSKFKGYLSLSIDESYVVVVWSLEGNIC